MTQAQLAKRIQSSQARVAKMEGGDPQASLESLIRAVTAAGSRVRVTVTRARQAEARARVLADLGTGDITERNRDAVRAEWHVRQNERSGTDGAKTLKKR